MQKYVKQAALIKLRLKLLQMHTHMCSVNSHFILHVNN